MHNITQGDEPAIMMNATALKNFISNFRDVATGSALNFFKDIMIPGSKFATNLIWAPTFRERFALARFAAMHPFPLWIFSHLRIALSNIKSKKGVRSRSC